MTMTLAQLEAEVLRLRAEMGAYDKDATPWHQRQGQLTDAFDAMAARLADVPGGQLASDVAIAKFKALGLGGGVSSPPASTSGAIEGDSAKFHGTGAAEITLLSNEQQLDPQNPTHVHHNVVSGGNDGGFRLIQNGLFEDSTRPRSILGLDSMGEVSYSQDMNGVIDPSQSFVVKLDYARKVLMLCSMKAGWTWEIRESTATNKFDRVVFP